MQNQNSNQPQQHAEQEVVEQPLSRQNAVLVFGSGGKVGRKIVAEVRGCCLLLVLAAPVREAEQLSVNSVSFPAACSCWVLAGMWWLPRVAPTGCQQGCPRQACSWGSRRAAGALCLQREMRTSQTLLHLNGLISGVASARWPLPWGPSSGGRLTATWGEHPVHGRFQHNQSR